MARGAASAFRRTPSRLSGSVSCIFDVSVRAGLWQLPERVYLSHALGLVGGHTPFGVPLLQTSDSFLRQLAGPELAAAGRTVPPLQSSNFAALPAHRATDRLSL